jgi:fucose permease
MDAGTAGAAEVSGRRLLLRVGLGSSLVVGATVALHGPSLPLYAARYGIGLAEAAGIVAAQWGGAFLAVAALMAGVRLTARWALAALALGCGLIAAGISWPLTLAGALILGCGHGLSSAVFNSRLLAEFGPRGPAVLGLANALFGVGAIAGPLLLLAAGSDPRIVFAGLALGAALLWPFARPPARPVGGPAEGAPLGSLLSRGRGVVWIGLVAVGAEASLAGLGPAALIARGATQEAAALWASGFFAAFVLARLALVWLAVRVAARRLLQGGLAGLALALAGATLGPPGPFFVAAGAAVGILFPSYFVLGADRLGRTPRAGAVLVAASLAGGVSLPAALAGIGAGLFPALAGLALLLLLALPLLAPRPAD